MQSHSLDQLDASETAALLALVIERVRQIGQPAIDALRSLMKGAPLSDAFDSGYDLIYRWADDGGDDRTL